MRKVTSKPTMPKSWVSSPLTRALCAAGLNSTNKVSKSSGLAWSNIENIATGKTRNPHSATIQKLMAVSGISRQQYGGHTRVINAMHTPVDKSVVKRLPLVWLPRSQRHLRLTEPSVIWLSKFIRMGKPRQSMLTNYNVFCCLSRIQHGKIVQRITSHSNSGSYHLSHT